MKKIFILILLISSFTSLFAGGLFDSGGSKPDRIQNRSVVVASYSHGKYIEHTDGVHYYTDNVQIKVSGDEVRSCHRSGHYWANCDGKYTITEGMGEITATDESKRNVSAERFIRTRTYSNERMTHGGRSQNNVTECVGARTFTDTYTLRSGKTFSGRLSFKYLYKGQYQSSWNKDRENVRFDDVTVQHVSSLPEIKVFVGDNEYNNSWIGADASGKLPAVSFKVTGGALVGVKINNNTYGGSPGVPFIQKRTPGHGNHTYTITATDVFGRPVTKTVTIYMDKIKPSISLAGNSLFNKPGSGVNPNLTNESIPLVFSNDCIIVRDLTSGIKSKTITVKKNGGAPYTVPSGSVLSESGSYDIRITAEDKAGNKSLYPEANDKNIVIDKDPPVISKSQFEPYYSFPPNTKIIDFVNDKSGVTFSEHEPASIRIYQGSTEIPHDTLVTESTYSVVYYAVDAVGNSTTVESKPFTVDGTQPVITVEKTGATIDAPRVINGENEWTNADITTYSITIEDCRSRISTFNTSFNVSENAGNASKNFEDNIVFKESENGIFGVDKPSITDYISITEDLSKATATKKVFNLSINRKDAVILKTKLTFSGKDAAGNPADAKSLFINIDRKNPEFPIFRLDTTPVNSNIFYTGNNFGFKYSVSDNESGVNLNSTKYLLTKSTETVTFTPSEPSVTGSSSDSYDLSDPKNSEGLYSFSIQSSDMLGNTGTSKTERIYYLKNRAKIDPSAFRVGQNGGFSKPSLIVPINNQEPFVLIPDYFTGKLENFYRNELIDPESWEYKLSGPKVTSLNGFSEPGKWEKIKVNPPENIIINFGDYGSYSPEGKFNLDGDYTLTIRVKDVFAQQSEEADFQFTVDGTAPVINKVVLKDNGGVTIDKDLNDVWINEDLNLSLSVTEDFINKKEYKLCSSSWEDLHDWVVLPPEGITFSSSAETFIKFMLTDKAGNRSDIKRYIVKMDKDKPVFNAINPLFDKALNYSHTLPLKDMSSFENFFQADASGISKIEYMFLDEYVYKDEHSFSDGFQFPQKYNVTDESFTELKNEAGQVMQLPEIWTTGKQNILFRAFDSAGNYTYQAQTVRIDRVPPVIDSLAVQPGSLNSVNVTDSFLIHSDITFLTLGAVKSPSLDIVDTSWKYNLNGSGDKEFKEGIVFDTSQWTDGDYTLVLSVVDKAGNRGEKSLTLIKDTTAPVVDSGVVELYLDNTLETLYDNRQPTNENLLYPRISNIEEGVVYFYSFSELPLIPSDHSSLEKLTTALITPEEKKLYYLHMFPEDPAGNRSDKALIYKVKINKESAPAPRIKSSSLVHMTGVDMASSENSPVFTFFSDEEGASSIIGYNYLLKKGGIELFKGYVEGPGEAILELQNLEDSLAGEFYTLIVTSRTEIHEKSNTEGVFQFRIDTRPPENLTVHSTTHRLDDHVYSPKEAEFYWSKDLTDSTGIRHIYYTYKVEDGPFPEDSTGWQLYTGKNLLAGENAVAGAVTIDLTEVLGSERGSVRFAVCAEDMTGLKSYSQRVVHLDAEKPVFNKESVSIVNNVTLGYSDISWSAEDAGGLDKSILTIKKPRNEVEQYIVPENNTLFTQRIYGLEENKEYEVIIEVLDTVSPEGNKSVRSFNFYFNENNALTLNVKQPYYENIEGYVLEGIYNTADPALSEISLTLPPSLTLGEEQVIPLSSCSFVNGKFVSGENRTLISSFIVNGFTLNFEGILFTESRGLILQNVTTPLFTDPVNKIDINIPEAAIRSPHALMFADSAGYIVPSVIDYSSPPYDNGWKVTAMEGVGLAQRYLNFDKGFIGFKENFNTELYRIQEGVNEYIIPVTDLVIDSESRILSADLPSDNLYLKGDGYSLEILESALEKDGLRILKSRFLPEGDFKVTDQEGNDKEIYLENFFIDRQGQFRELPGWKNNEFYINSSEGYRFFARTLNLNRNSLVIGGNMVKEGVTQTETEFSQLRLTSFGLDDTSVSASANSYTGIFHGFKVTSDSAFITKGGILLSEAVVHLPLTLLDSKGTAQKPVIKNLHLSFSSKIQAPVSGKDKISFIYRSYYGKTGKEVKADGYTLNTEGFFLKRVSLELPGIFNNQKVIIPSLELFDNGEMGKAVFPGDGTYLVMDGSEAIVTDLTFNKDKFILPELILSLPPGCKQTSLSLVNREINYHNPVPELEAIRKVDYQKDGWDFKIRSLELTQEGISGAAYVQLPETLFNKKINIEKITLDKEGNFTTADSVVSSELSLGGRDVTVKGINFAGDNIRFDHADFYITDEISFVLKDLTINSEGSIVNSGTDLSLPLFISANGFKVQTSGVTVEKTQLILQGSVFFPDYFGEGVVGSFNKIVLDENNYIQTEINDSPLSYKLNDIPLKASGYSVFDEGLLIGNNALVIGDKTLNIKGLTVAGDSEILSAGVIAGNENLIDINGWNFEVSAAGFKPKGLSLDSILTLPENLGSQKIAFEEMMLYKENGQYRFTTNMLVKDLKFTQFGMDFYFDTIGVTPDSLFIRSADILLPPEMGGENLSIKYLEITSAGEFILEGSESDPFSLYGVDVYLRELSFKDNKLLIGGEVLFPYDYALEPIAGELVTIRELSYDFNNKDVFFDLSLSGFEFEIIEGWRTRIEGFNVSNNEISIDTGTLYFPPKWLDNISIESAGFKGMSFNLNTKEFAVDEINTGIIEVNCEGYEFTITRVAFSHSDGFSFGGRFPLPGLFEGEDVSPVLAVHNLRVGTDFSIKELDASLKGGSYSFTPNGELIYTGDIGVAYMEDQFCIDLSGSLIFGSTFDVQDLRGEKLSINRFRFDIQNRVIKELDAALTLREINLFDTKVSDFVAGLKMENPSSPLDITLGGNILVPDNVPGLNGEIFKLRSTFTTEGKVKDLSAGITTTKDKTLLGDLVLKKGSGVVIEPVKKNPGEDVFSLKGLQFSFNNSSVVFGPDFAVKGLADSVLDLNMLTVTTTGELVECDMAFKTHPTMTVYDDISLLNGRVLLVKDTQNNDILTTIGGKLALPETYGGLTVGIDYFTVSSSGKIAISAEASGLSGNVYDQLQLNNGSIAVQSGLSKGEVLLQAEGDFKITSQSVPDVLRSRTLKGGFVFSTTRGIRDFSVGLTGEVMSIEVFNGINLGIDTLVIKQNSFEAAVGLTVPQGYYGLGQDVNAAASFEMGWDGSIDKLEASVYNLNMELIGLGLFIEELQFSRDGIYLSRAVLTMPEALQKQKVALTDARISSSGEFSGNLSVEKLSAYLLGCTVNMYYPQISIKDKNIQFDKAEFVLPSALGGITTSLDYVKISKSGLDINGGSFQMAPFEVAGGLKFSNVGATFIVKDNGEYEIGGGGKVFIENVGEVEAQISLVNISSTYPIGLKYAYFSFKVENGGIPLGPTGLLLNGVAGGIAFGPPGVDMPPDIRDKFGSGMRIQLGIYVTHSSKIMDGEARLWLNLYNFDFAIQGKVEFFEAMFTAYARMLYTRSYGLELAAGVEFSAFGKIFIEGHARAHIFYFNGGPRFCGEAFVNIGVRDILWGFPSSTFWLARVGVEAGDFSNNIRGFKGYITVPVIGTRGVFVQDNFSWSVGNVSKYVLLDKSSEYTGALTDSRAVVYSFDMGSTRTASNQTESPVSPEDKVNKAFVGEETERLIFAVDFTEGDPVVSAISPSGRVYKEGDADTETARLTDKILMAVINPEQGQWTIKVDNLKKDSDYQVQVAGYGANPEIEVYTPSSLTYGNESFTVTGKTSVYAGENPVVTIYLSREEGLKVGKPVAEAVVEEDGSFSAEIDTYTLGNGEYFIYAGVFDGHNPELTAFAPGSLFIDRDGRDMKPVEEFIAGVDGGSVTVSFKDTSGDRSAGFTLYVLDTETGEEEKVGLGHLTKARISFLDPEKEYIFTVAPYNSDKEEGPRSRPVTVNFQTVPVVKNTFTVSVPEVILEIGEAVDVPLLVNPVKYVETLTAQDYTEVKILEAPDFIIPNIMEERLSLKKSGTFTLNLNSFEAFTVDNPLGEGTLTRYALPGDYVIKAEVKNMGNPDLVTYLEIPVKAVYPMVEVSAMSQESWHVFDSAELTLKGDGFVQGTRVFIDDKELTISERDNNTLVCQVPPLGKEASGLLKVENPGGKSFMKELELVYPSFALRELKTESLMTKGSTGWYYVEVKGKERFDDSVNVTVSGIPEGWIVNYPSAARAGDILAIEVITPENVKTGSYDMAVKFNNKDITLYSDITVNDPDPHIVNLSRFSANWGDRITLYGWGFESNAEVLLNGQPVTVLNNSRDTLEIVIPDTAESGEIIVKRGIHISNAAAFEIRDDNFNIYTSKNVYKMKAGEELSEELLVMGYAKQVTLETETDNPSISLYLHGNSVTPNGAVIMDIKVAEGTDPGIYRVKITGKGIRREKVKEFTVAVGDVYSFMNKGLKPENLGESYREELKTLHGDGLSYFNIVEGALPEGLRLNTKTGIIKGRARDAGLFMITVEADDEAGRRIQKEFALIIEDNGWFREDNSTGNNRYYPGSLPGEEKTGWKSHKSEGAYALLAGDDKVYTVSDTMLTARSSQTGGILYTKELNIQNAAYENGKLFILDDTTLRVFDRNTGEELKTLENVEAFRLHSTSLYLLKKGVTFEVNIHSLEGEKEISEDLFSPDLVVSSNNIYKTDGEKLSVFRENQWELLLNNPVPVADVVENDTRLGVLNTLGELSLYEEGKKLFTVDSGIGSGKLIVGAQRSVVYNDSSAVILDHETLKTLVIDEVISDVILGGDKLVVIRENGFALYNLYTGDLIWDKSGDFSKLITAGNRIFVINSIGETICFDGPENIEAPVTTVMVMPSAPDGSNGFYTREPELHLSSSDKEGRAESFYSVNGEEWSPYDESLFFSDGIYNLEYRSIDNHEKREDVLSKEIKVDTTAPVSSYSIDGNKRDEGEIYADSIVLTLAAEDNLSGIDIIEYSLNGGNFITYESPVIVDVLGDYTLTWRALDRAGNLEENNSYSFTLMHGGFPPIEAKYYLKGRKLKIHGGGQTEVKRIEYTLNGSDIQIWEEPLYPEDGLYTLKYRCINRFGFKGEWQTLNFLVDSVAPVSAHKLEGHKRDEGEIYADTVELILSAEDNSSGIRSIEYALNGGEYSAYEGPVTIEGPGDYSLTWRAVDKAGNREENNSYTFTIIDGGFPPLEPRYIVKERKLEITGGEQTEVKRIEYTLNGSEIQTYEEPLQPEDAQYTLKYRCINRFLFESEWQTFNFLVDSAAPESAHKAAGIKRDTGEIYAESVEITLSAWDDSSGVDYIEYSFDGREFMIYESPVTYEELGDHTLSWRAVDKAGNREVNNYYNFTIMHGGFPEIEAEYFADGRFLEIFGGVQTEVKRIEYTLNGSDIQIYERPLFPEDGMHVLKYRCVNRFLFEGEWKTFEFLVDSVSPKSSHQFSGFKKGDMDIFIESAVLILTAEDNAAGVEYIEYRLDGGEFKLYRGPVIINTPGSHSVEYRSRDKALNTEAVQRAFVDIGNAGGMGSEAIFHKKTREVEIIGLRSDNLEKVEYFNPYEGVIRTYREPLKFIPGQHILYYRDVEKSGMTGGWKQIIFTVEEVPPVVYADYISAEGKLTFNGLDTVKRVEYHIPGGGINTYSTPLYFPKGSHIFYYRVVDLQNRTYEWKQLYITASRDFGTSTLTPYITGDEK